MSSLERELPASVLRWEALAVCIAAWVAFVSIPLAQGEIGLSWDALNHHIYLGWTAEHPRFDRDFVAAGYQAYQFPYLYWPVFKLATGGWSGAAAGVVLATLHLIAVPPVWMLARTCMPGRTLFDAAMRALAVVMAFMTGVVLSLFDATQNDLMAAAPLVWALALAMQPLGSIESAKSTARRWVLWSGICAGVSVAFKLSNGPLAILLPLLWVLPAGSLRERATNVLVGGVATILGFLVTYGYWGALLWKHFGNPVYPFYGHLFDALRIALGHGA